MNNSKNNYTLIMVLVLVVLLVLVWIVVFVKKDKKWDWEGEKTQVVETSLREDGTASTYYTEWELDKLVNYLEWKVDKGSSEDDKLYLVQAYVAYGNSFYTESEYSEKALEMLNWMTETFDVLYYKWYANEIAQKYEEALNYYTQARNMAWLTTEQEAFILNQIGHLYDLQWDTTKAREYYTEASNLWVDLVWNLINLWRMEYNTWNYEKAEEYFNQVLDSTDNKLVRAEMYANISWISIMKWDMAKAKENAEKWIKEQENYPLNHVYLWIAYMNSNEINEAFAPFTRGLELYPQSAIAAKYIWAYYYTIDDFDKAIEYFNKQLENADKDIILMENERLWYREEAYFDLARSYAYQWKAEDAVKYIDMLIWDGKHVSYYISFMSEYVVWDGAFYRLADNEVFMAALEKYKSLYGN